MTRTITILVILFGFSIASEAQAQHLFRKGAARQTASMPTAAPAPTSRISSYSYYTRSSLPARTYVGYGNNDFPYHGAPYGHPYDPYTFSAMSNSYQAELSRYYSPPLR